MHRQLAWPEFREVLSHRNPEFRQKEGARIRWQGSMPCLLFVQMPASVATRRVRFLAIVLPAAPFIVPLPRRPAAANEQVRGGEGGGRLAVLHESGGGKNPPPP